MLAMSELELKFQVPPHAVAALRAELHRRGGHVVRMTALYYDTPGFDLAKKGLSLRLRREGAAWMQTLKAAGSSTVHRLEHNVALRANGAATPTLDLHRHDGTGPGEALRKLVGGDAQDAQLAVRYATDIERLVCDLRLPDAIVEAAFDAGTIRSGERSERICELELEYKSGAIATLFELARLWRAHGNLRLDTRSKAARGVSLARDDGFGPAVKARKPQVFAGIRGTPFVRAVLRVSLDQVLANASAVGAGSTDEEHIHQLRVGLRRLRTALRELAPLDARIAGDWEKPLAHSFALLGDVRDSVTAARAVQPLLELAGAPRVDWSTAANADPVAVVQDAQFQAVLLDLLSFALQDDDGPQPRTHADLLAFLAARLSRLHRRVGRAARRFERLPLEDQHKARKRLKRLRYLAEFAGPLYDRGAVKRYLAHLEPAQDALGKHVDIAVAMERFRKHRDVDAPALFAARYLEGYLGNTARLAHAALQEPARAQPFWNR
jgi:inorganic triphosphatase YgiF